MSKTGICLTVRRGLQEPQRSALYIAAAKGSGEPRGAPLCHIGAALGISQAFAYSDVQHELLFSQDFRHIAIASPYVDAAQASTALRPSNVLMMLFSLVLPLSLIHISEPTRRTPISYAVFCLTARVIRARLYCHAECELSVTAARRERGTVLWHLLAAFGASRDMWWRRPYGRAFREPSRKAFLCLHWES